ncbi:MAG: hypothetical protein J7525_19740 [Roseofilum sp. SID3]|uniref:hypothetical protein n=1 Tax=Roseofilum sp. SID3 TaxID=2821499 RepID=UPI001B2668A0|nr:hypothetical protein [Roseofilum sp. SID3]MBP0015329.1 hypothetical protein [Roseofilum sp. SID3]
MKNKIEGEPQTFDIRRFQRLFSTIVDWLSTIVDWLSTIVDWLSTIADWLSTIVECFPRSWNGLAGEGFSR